MPALEFWERRNARVREIIEEAIAESQSERVCGACTHQPETSSGVPMPWCNILRIRPPDGVEPFGCNRFEPKDGD